MKSKMNPIAYDIDFCDYAKIEQIQNETEDDSDVFSDDESIVSEPEKSNIEQDELKALEEFNNQYSFIKNKKKKDKLNEKEKAKNETTCEIKTIKDELHEEAYLTDDSEN